MAFLRKFPGSKNWYGGFTLPDGRRVQRSTGQSDRDIAWGVCLEWERAAKMAKAGNFTEDAARRILSHVGEIVGVEAVPTVKAGAFLNEWAASKKVTKSPATAARYAQVIREFLAAIGTGKADKNLAGITAADVSRWRDGYVEKGLSPSSANQSVKILRVALNVARRQGLILTNPAEAVEMLPAEQAQRETFTREQIAALLAAADTEWRGMILLGVCHGVRIGDASRMTWANVNAARQSLVFYPAKTSRGAKRKPEEMPLHPDLASHLESLPAGDDPKAPLFPRLCGCKVGGNHGLSREFFELMRKAGVQSEIEAEAEAEAEAAKETDAQGKAKEKRGGGRSFRTLSFHSLRHTAISEQANIGIAREVRMKLSGHKTAVHDRYTHHELETLRREVEKVPSFIPKESPETEA